MTVQQLINALKNYPMDIQVVISDHSGDGSYNESIGFSKQPANVLVKGSITMETNRPGDVLVLL